MSKASSATRDDGLLGSSSSGHRATPPPSPTCTRERFALDASGGAGPFLPSAVGVAAERQAASGSGAAGPSGHSSQPPVMLQPWSPPATATGIKTVLAPTLDSPARRPKRRPTALTMSKEELQQQRPALDGAFDDAALSPLLRSVRLDVDWLRLGASLGRGSFGAVYATSWIAGDGAAGSRLLADAGAPQALAVKSIYSQQLQNDMQLSRVKRALETELQLQPHAHVCRCFAWACSEQSGQLLLVYEYCGGGTLKAALDAGRTAAWPVSRKLLVAAQLAEGLASLHGHEPRRWSIATSSWTTCSSTRAVPSRSATSA